MLSNLINTSGWTHEQWLAACILAFAVLSIAVVMHRLLKLFRMTKKSSYQPNLRPLRRRRLQDADKSVQQDE
ncbi:MAG: hypothetical protein P8N94_15820 [Gammaproteobacteria bacterium]|nr:hypothetical protein [Gammaproteobacteria bacterium]MDG2339428.1 hypothetical protein [Gammaproteobacteria bacterium]